MKMQQSMFESFISFHLDSEMRLPMFIAVVYLGARKDFI